MAFLRNALIISLDDQLVQLTTSDVAVNSLLETTTTDGVTTFKKKPDAVTDYSVAIYGPDGARVITAGGDRDGPQPLFPETRTLQHTQERGTTPFEIPSDDGTGVFHASADIYPPDGAAVLYSQVVALPLAPINRVVTTYLGIYSILALITIVASALLTRWLVTLTFRSLGQVESTAMTIATGDFSQRMTDIEPIKTEVGRLKTAINAMLDRVDAAITERDSTVRQMRRFIGDASHELRTPLVTVRGYAELYRMGAIEGDEDVTQAMDRIESEAKRMGFLVEDLLALARLDERRDVVIAPVDLRPIARDAAMDVRAASPLRPVSVLDTTLLGPPPIAEEASEPEPHNLEAPKGRRGGASPSAKSRAGATLSLLRRRPRPVPAIQASGVGEAPPVAPVDLGVEESSDTPPIVLGDENRIRQVVANLLGNARRFTGEDSPIELRIGIDVTTEMGWIEIVDHGEGVPDQIKEKIFQRFWRADTSRARETGGTGLGLSIVASIVEALHGSVDVVDTPGGGATFRVALPLASEAITAARASLPTQPLTRVRDQR
ncbi:cell wall metabolism sensor histidine kinase WalK [Microbacterium sp. SS28]|uniref:sensor histidine kinase n=1 Tax=Microbacterium sp. SS28 TaxID=2919948 RepID=UPI001FAA091F|nr:HAMP domain-containing sensor histidine kinase [Microbacterium sp. SS28]